MSAEISAETARLPLSVLIDEAAGSGPRDERFVRRFADWMAERASHLHLEPIDALGLVDVVMTFRMKRVVTLVVTGRRPDMPGEITVHFGERDFPFVGVVVDREPRRDPADVCTLDYSVAGRPIALVRGWRRGVTKIPEGARGQALVEATIGARRELRVTLDHEPGVENDDTTDEVVTLPSDVVRWLDEALA